MTNFTFTESAPYEHYNRVDAQIVQTVDVFAATDKGAAFVTRMFKPFHGGRLLTDSRCHNIEAQTAKERFCESDGKYYMSYNCLSGSLFNNPLDFLAHVENKAYTFRRELRFAPMFIPSKRTDSVPFVTFHGNLKQISVAFGYVIYDGDILTAVIEAANRILARDGKAGWEYKDGEIRRNRICT